MPENVPGLKTDCDIITAYINLVDVKKLYICSYYNPKSSYDYCPGGGGRYSDFCLLQGLGLGFWVQTFEFRYFFGCRGFVNYFYGYANLTRYFWGYVIFRRYVF